MNFRCNHLHFCFCPTIKGQEQPNSCEGFVLLVWVAGFDLAWSSCCKARESLSLRVLLVLIYKSKFGGLFLMYSLYFEALRLFYLSRVRSVL